MGKFGIVNLYEKKGVSSRSSLRLVAQSVRALRSPFKDNQIGILVLERDANPIISADGPFFIAVQNEKQTGTHVVKPSRIRKRPIFVEEITE